MKPSYNPLLLGAILLPSLLFGCSSDDSSDSTGTSVEVDTSESSLQRSTFEDGAISEFDTVDCTLSSGIETTCYSITIAGLPPTRTIGPFCPTTTSTLEADAGIWLDGTGAYYDADGSFILNLPNLYSTQYSSDVDTSSADVADDWIFYDELGDVNYTVGAEACAAAANPDVGDEYRNYCVQCTIDDTETGEPVEKTFLIPVTPMPLDVPVELNGTVGIAIDGVILEAAAPVEVIMSAITIAAFDDCGGHVNPFEGYHYHTSTGADKVASAGCARAVEADGHAPLIGYARDGYAIFAERDEDGLEHDDLDVCRGATDETRGYHYHTSGVGENTHIGCYHGDIVADDEAAGGGPPDGGGPPPEVAG